VLKGDAGDGVPNIFSDDDTFVSEKRQKPMTQKKMDQFYLSGKPDDVYLRNFSRNQQLIDLNYIPENIKNAVIDKYNEESGKDRSKLFNYFVTYKLKHMMENVGEF
jgi:hypothetical protein